MISENKDFSMNTETHSKTAAEHYIVDKKGNPAAVIIPVKNYLSMLAEIEDYREMKHLSQSADFVRLIRKYKFY